ncbi:MAG TPA: 5,6-dimethylbenzimidazole synthase [Stellaceae bacterium]|jgi:5,6-dimethylbenzimidazole synthase|nr:5,6-dimethylbenzimidazole synthase [Stellaceae bacterium]
MPEFDEAFRARLVELLTWRRDVRRFRADTLPEGLLEHLLEIAALAPSVGLSQPWRFVLVEDAKRRAEVRANFERANAAALDAYEGEEAQSYARLKLAGLDEAPVHLAVFADPGTTQGRGLGRRTMPEMIEYSAVTAIHTLWLAARAEGVGLGWVSILDPAAVARSLEVPPEWSLVGYLCLGYPSEADDTPALERAGWERRRAAASFLLRR